MKHNPTYFIGMVNKYNSLYKLRFMKTGIELIAQERKEQIEKHGHTLDTDIEDNDRYQLSKAASILALHESQYGCNEVEDFVQDYCPDGWDEGEWSRMLNKPYSERIIIAAAMLAAESDRINSIVL